MPTSNWDEIRTAYHVALHGTVSGAADALGVHHATVIRHVDALEARIGVKLFQRHARGYTATEAGEDLLKVGQATDDQLNQLISRIRGRGTEVRGELVVTTIAGISGLLMPLVSEFQAEHPELTVRYLTDTRLFRLEYGEAHVAIRAGNAPQEPDNVVQTFAPIRQHLVAAPSYIARHGLPKESDFSGHRFVGHANDNHPAPFYRWMREHVPQESILFRGSEGEALENAVIEGMGIGFVSSWRLQRHDDLVEVMPTQHDWETRLWLVTHVDLHRTTKVQSFVNFLKNAARDQARAPAGPEAR